MQQREATSNALATAAMFMREEFDFEKETASRIDKTVSAAVLDHATTPTRER
jgi:hypothetical protein